MICICVGHQGDGPNLETEAGAVAGTMCGLTRNQIIGAQTRYEICAFLIKERPGWDWDQIQPLVIDHKWSETKSLVYRIFRTML